VLGLDALELDGNVFTGDNIGSEIDVTKGPTTDFTTDVVFITYTKNLKRLVLCLQIGNWKDVTEALV
jgi:hypothetical protein